MSKTEKRTKESRRNFLKMAALAAPAAATAVVSKEAEAAQTEAKGTGLRKTDHVKAYLDSARF